MKMKIKTKLIVSFCIIIFVPIILISMVLFGFHQVQRYIFQRDYGITDANPLNFISSVKLLDRYTLEEFQELIVIAETNPDELLNAQYLDSMNGRLNAKFSYLVVRTGNIIIYNGGADNMDELEALPPFGRPSDQNETSGNLDSSRMILTKQIDFAFSGGILSSAFIVTDAGNVIPEIRRMFAQLVVSMVLILFMTAAVLLLWIYRSLITPIRQLQVAADNIKEGNLDFEITATGNDEIGALAVSFEEMRARLKANAEEKIESESENRALISNIAHDLKTPITAVKGYAEGILDGVASTPEKVEKYVRTIYNKANEMDTLINELTLYSKIDTNRIPYNFAKIHVVDYFNDCIEEVGLDLESRGVLLSYINYVEPEAMIIADPEQLRRVINNIISNSVKYMNKTKKTISIRVKDVGDFIQVEMEDNGRGIASHDLPYIFDRFYRTDASRNSATGGSGIGLSIVKKIVEDHGGKIWATSKEDIGTVMYFVIRKYQEDFNE